MCGVILLPLIATGEDGLDQSLVSDYEAKLTLKKEEVSQLLQEREELRATHNRLLTLKKKMHFRQVCTWWGCSGGSCDCCACSSWMTRTLTMKQFHKRKYTYLFSTSSRHGILRTILFCVLWCSDLTAATWGGSTVQSDPEDTATSVSLPSDIAADITQESNQNTGELWGLQIPMHMYICMCMCMCGSPVVCACTEPPDHGEGATIEQVGRGKTPPFSVTRHTPRTRGNVRLRTQSVDSTEATLRADKKMKIDPKVKAKGRNGGMLKSEFGSHS